MVPEFSESPLGYEQIITLGKNLYKALDYVPPSVKGIIKLKRKIHQEIYGVEKAKQANTLKKEQLTCSNLHHYEAFVNCILNDKHCVSVLEGFNVEDNIVGRRKIYVDIVTEEKRKWRKVIARNPKALSQISVGDGEYQQKSIVDHAQQFLKCADQNVVFFKPPLVEFYFACGIEMELAETLSSMGIIVTGKILGDAPLSDDISQLAHTGAAALTADIKKLNLDVTAMIAYVSALTNGHADRKVRGNILNQHAEWERRNPIKPILDEFFEGKELFVCKRALSDFKSIVDIIGGEGEKERAEELYRRIKVVEDWPLENLEPRGQIKERGLAVFGTGRHIQAITVTANSAFVRAALTKGIHLDVFIHEPRSLTEQKEIL